MSKQRRNAVSFSAIAVAGLIAYLWVVSDAFQAQVVHADNPPTATLGAAATVTPVPEPAIWQLFDAEKKAAPATEMPAQF
jgi:hypothetical protein